MASTRASTLALSRPSEKLGTHSTMVDIREKHRRVNDWAATHLCVTVRCNGWEIASRAIARMRWPFKPGLILRVVSLTECLAAGGMNCILIRSMLAARRPWAAGFIPRSRHEHERSSQD